MSIITSVSPVTKMQTDPFGVPAGMIAAAPLTRPSAELSVETNGCVWPHGNVVKYPRDSRGTTLIFSEDACAVLGILQLLLGIATPGVVRAPKNGPPKGPFGFRVSATRHGVTGTKRRAVGLCALKPIAQSPPLALSQFCWIRYWLPRRTTSAIDPFNALKVEPNLKLHKSPFSPAVLLWNQASPLGSVTVSFSSWAMILAIASAPSLALGLGF